MSHLFPLSLGALTLQLSVLRLQGLDLNSALLEAEEAEAHTAPARRDTRKEAAPLLPSLRDLIPSDE